MKAIKIPIIHLSLWILLGFLISRLYPLIELEVEVTEAGTEEILLMTHPYNHLVLITVFAFFFYTHSYYLFPRKFLKGPKWEYFTYLSLLILATALIQYFLDKFWISQLTVTPNGFSTEKLGGYFVDPIGFSFTGVLHINAIVFTLGYSFFTSWSKDQALKKQIIEDKIRAENRELRSQVNPHFLFNTLNTFFSMAQEHGVTEVEEGVATLAEMFRYTLDNNQTAQIELEKELGYLSAFVYLQKLRFKDGDDVDVRFDVKGESKGLKIHQMLLINFIENAFKHGIHVSNKSFVHIHIIAEADFHLIVQNSISKSSSATSHGVGLKNAQERLQLLYPGQHQLDFNISELTYEVKLNLQL